MPSIPDTLAALKAKTIRREDAVELLIPEYDRILALELIPVVGGAAEAISDQFLRPLSVCTVNTAQRMWAKERAAAKAKK